MVEKKKRQREKTRAEAKEWKWFFVFKRCPSFDPFAKTQPAQLWGKGVLPPLPSSRKQKLSFNSLYLLKRHQFLVATYFRSLLSLLALGRTFSRRRKKNDALLSSRRSCCYCKSSQILLTVTSYACVSLLLFFFFLTFAYMKTPKLINR